MLSQPDLTAQALLERVQAVWRDLFQDIVVLSTAQRTSIRKCSVLIELDRDSIKRNSSKKKSHVILSNIWEHSQDLFVLCALAIGPWRLSHLRSTDYLQVLLSWWYNVNHHDFAGRLKALYPDMFPRDRNVDVIRSCHPDLRVATNKDLGTPHLSLASVEDERPSKRLRTLGTTDNSTTFPLDEVQSEPTAVPEESLNHAFGENIELYENADLKGINKVFNRHIGDAIRRIPQGGDLTGAVTMVFPPWADSFDATMSLDVYEQDVEQLAMTLFNVKVKWVDQALHMVSKGGITMVIPNANTALRGASEQAIEEVFGPVVLRSVAESPARERELARGTQATECVSMIFTKNGAFINLCLGLNTGHQICRDLFK